MIVSVSVYYIMTIITVGLYLPDIIYLIGCLIVCGGNPIVVGKHQIQPECGDEQSDAGRDDCRTRLARPNSH